MRKWYPAIPILLAYVVGFAVYDRLPEQVPRHWDVFGSVNGWSSRAFAVLFFPTIVLGVWALLRWLPTIDPRRANYDRFQDTYELLIAILVTMLVAVHFAVLGSALGMLQIDRALPIVIALVLLALGNTLPRMRSNEWLGIRTPWTLSNDRVWARTHRVGGYLMVAVGIVGIIGACVAPQYGGAALGVAGAVAALASVIYSYVAWKEETSR